jgi:hypothetical protein
MSNFYALPSNLVLEIYKYIPISEINKNISLEWNEKVNRAFKYQLQTSSVNWVWVWQNYKNLDLIYNENTVLDLRGEISCWVVNKKRGTFDYVIEKYKHRLNHIEVLVFDRQIDLEKTVFELDTFIKMLPKLKYLDLCRTFCNGGTGYIKLKEIITSLLDRGVKVDFYLEYIFGNESYLGDLKPTIYYLDIEPCANCKYDEYEFTCLNRCEPCNKINLYTTTLLNILWGDDNPDLNPFIQKLNDIIELIPNFIIENIKNYFLGMSLNSFPFYIDKNKITTEIVKNALKKLLRKFKIIPNPSHYVNEPNFILEGHIFNIFSLSEWNRDGGWHTLFDESFDYPEIYSLLRYITEQII